jgi:hypothetical protein
MQPAGARDGNRIGERRADRPRAGDQATIEVV